MKLSRLQLASAMVVVIAGLVPGFLLGSSLSRRETQAAVASNSRPTAVAAPATASATASPSPSATRPPVPSPVPPQSLVVLPSPTITPTPRSSCSAIAGTVYTSEAEQRFYLSRCLATPTATATARPATTPTAASLSEAAYRSQAAAQVAALLARLAQHYARETPSEASRLELANINLQLALALDSMPPPPAFAAVHNELRSAALAIYTFQLTGVSLEDPAARAAREANLGRFAAALSSYARVVGIDLPQP